MRRLLTGKPVSANFILSVSLAIIVLFWGWKSIDPVLKAIPIVVNKGIQGISTIFTIQNNYDNQFYVKQQLIDLNALAQNLMGIKMMNGIVKDSNGHLHSVIGEAPIRKKIEDTSKSVIQLYDLAINNKTPFIFVQVPSKYIEGKTELPIGLTDYSNDEYDIWLDIMRKKNIPTIDLRKELQDNNEFYKTDHHWTVRASFYAAVCVIQGIEKYFGREYDKSYLLVDNYTSTIYKNSFLGSYGFKVGRFYAGKDDFEILTPVFATDFNYIHLIKHKIVKETAGTFKEAFIDYSKLENKDYNNKYDANLYMGYVENIIINNKIDDHSKLLFISHSFGRSMVQYLSMHFHETRYLDPQDGRYNDSYIRYIESFQPDYIIVMYNGSIPL